MTPIPERPWLLLFAVGFLLCGCATTGKPVLPDEASAEPAAAAPQSPAVADNPDDPLEGFNRAMYTFNEKLDRYVLKPVAKGYRAVVPGVARKGVSNFFSNLHDPVVMLNNLLQGKPTRAAADLGRFAVNTTFGIFGLIDVATPIGLEKHEEDFGQTFGVWGVGDGAYLVLPFFGPSNLRDGVGLIPDWYAYPPNNIEDVSTRNELFVVETVSKRDRLLDASDILEQAAGKDPYVFVREAYRQRRRDQIYDGNPPREAPDSLLFEEDSPAPQPSTPAGGGRGAPSGPQSR